MFSMRDKLPIYVVIPLLTSKIRVRLMWVLLVKNVFTQNWLFGGELIIGYSSTIRKKKREKEKGHYFLFKLLKKKCQCAIRLVLGRVIKFVANLVIVLFNKELKMLTQSKV